MVSAVLPRITTSILCSAIVIALLFLNPVAATDPETIAVEITTHLGDQQTFVEGDTISFFLSLDSDAYVYLFYRDAAGNNIQIFPNQRNRNHFYQEGFFMPLPPRQAKFQFKIQAPFGKEKLFVFTSDNADVELSARLLVNGLSLVDGSISEIEAVIRRQSGLRFGSASLTINSQSN